MIKNLRCLSFVRLTCACAVLAFFLGAPAFAKSQAKTQYLDVSLVSDRAAIAPGEVFHIALVERIQPGWHTYWRNPGDSGDPTRITWTLPKGYQAGDIIWPAPERIPYGPLANYGFKGEVRLPTQFSAPKSVKPGDLARFRASASWLVCKDVCVPENAILDIAIPVAAQSKVDAAGGGLIDAALQAAPKAADWPASFSNKDGMLGVIAPELAKAASAGALRSIYFFPDAPGMIEPADDQPAQAGADGVAFALPLKQTFMPIADKARVTGLLSYEIKGEYSWRRIVVAIEAKPGPIPPGVLGAPIVPHKDEPAAIDDPGAFPLALLLAFAGGLILNLMPCVFPVLSIKALSLTRAAHDSPKRMRAHGLAFFAGVLAAFATLGGALIALKAGGAAIGWGFQLQSPLMVGGLALLFFALALNLLGAFEIGGGFQGAGGELADRGGAAGAFFTGALAVVVATPCTAPFMGAALGFGLSAPDWQSFLIFIALGLGLAAPFTALAFAPGFARVLPKPGIWMVRFKEFLAFPMLAAMIWLVWVLAQQAGAPGVLYALSAMAGFGLFVWAAQNLKSAWRWVWSLVAAAIVAGAFASLPLESTPAADFPQSQSASAGTAQNPAAADAFAAEGAPWSAKAVKAARDSRKTVFVNFTAAWCITCKVNENLVLSREPVRAALSAKDVAYFVGDWTRRDAAIAAELAAHRRAGVPLYLVYKPGASDPIILPQILSEKTMLDALSAVTSQANGQ